MLRFHPNVESNDTDSPPPIQSIIHVASAKVAAECADCGARELFVIAGGILIIACTQSGNETLLDLHASFSPHERYQRI